MSTFDIAVVNGLIVKPAGMTAESLGIKDGRIAYIGHIDEADASEVVDAAHRLVFPGFIDAHNHPVYADSIEELSLQLAAGGVTSLIPFMGAVPAWGQTLEIAEALDSFIALGNDRSYLDFGVHATLLTDNAAAETADAMLRRGVISGKMFTCFSERGMKVNDKQILNIMRSLSEKGCIAMVHAENEAIVDSLEAEFKTSGRTSAEWYPRSRPAISEAEAVFRTLALAEIAKCPLYLVHLSARESLEVVAWFRKRGKVPIYVETCSHYLLMTEDEYDRQGGLVRISPPLRTSADVDALWGAVQHGEMDVIASDGSGQTLDRKGDPFGDIFAVPFGMPGVQFMIPLVADEGLNRRAISPTKLSAVFAERPARIFGLYPRKGAIDVGADADLVVFDQWAKGKAEVGTQLGNSDYTPYEGRGFQGAPVLTFQRGHIVLDQGVVRAKPGDGEFVPAMGRNAEGPTNLTEQEA